jgi:hypothetical protein
MTAVNLRITVPCMVGQHDRCRGVIVSLAEWLDGSPCECPAPDHVWAHEHEEVESP